MKYCPHCGNETPENAVYCPSCGKPIKESLQDNTEQAKPGVMIAFWIIQVYLAYTKRPQQFNNELIMIVCGFITSLIFYRILRDKVGTLAVSIITILLGLLGYFVAPSILSVILSLINKPS